MGGQVSLNAAKQRPDLFEKVILLCSSGYMKGVHPSLKFGSYVPYFYLCIKHWLASQGILKNLNNVVHDRSLIDQEMMDGYMEPFLDDKIFRALNRMIRDHEGDLSSEELKQEEDRSLEQVENFILENPNNICSVIIEPMLCEGGDRYASKRFFKKLRLLTKEYSIPLIFDEVQTGFGLGGDFFWHTHFDLESPPDFVTVAKRAQTGVVLSCVADSEPAQPHMINVQRGFIQAKLISQTDSRPIENLAAKYLENLQEEFSNQVFYPRHRGYAFAFDMPDTKSAMDLLAKRFELGFMAYIAGEKTLRFRLNMSTSEKEIKKLFEGLKAGLKNQPVVALDPALKADSCLRNDVRVVRLDKNNWQQYRDRIESIENKAYESGRRDSIEYLFDLATCENGLGLGLLDDKENLVGYAFGCP